MTKQEKYKTIVVDPPWKYGKWGPPSNRRGQTYDMPYSTMTVDEIKKIPVGKLADINCELYLWTTSKYLPNAFDVLKSWNFKYCQVLVWCKTPRGLGQGGVYAPTTEFILLGRKGKMPKARRVDSTWFNWKRQAKHSQKPEAFMDLVEQVTSPPRLELFARRGRLGWDVWGDEVESDIEL